MTDPRTPERDAAEALRGLLEEARARPLLERFPIEVAGRSLSAADVVRLLEPFLTEPRRDRIGAVVAGRTYQVVPVVEGLANVGNVSAVMRSAEALGYQGFHVVTTAGQYKQSARTSLGAEKWLDLWRWPTPADCVAHLRGQGYCLVATHLRADAVPVEAVDFTRKTALVFGNERDGVTDELLAACDQVCVVPLDGFTESFNVSVAAAVALYHARQDRLHRKGRHGDLTADERTALTADFYLRSVGRAEQILERVVRDAEAP